MNRRSFLTAAVDLPPRAACGDVDIGGMALDNNGVGYKSASR